MRIYRVETSCGLGAYNCGADFNGAATPTSPMPCDDVGLDWHGDWGHEFWDDVLFGFETLKHFRMWFSGNQIAALEQEECQVSVYEVQRYKHGSFQSVFDPSEAVLVKVLPLTDTYYGDMG